MAMTVDDVVTMLIAEAILRYAAPWHPAWSDAYEVSADIEDRAVCAGWTYRCAPGGIA